MSYAVPMPRYFVVLSTLLCAVIAFAIGRASRHVLLEQPTIKLLEERLELVATLNQQQQQIDGTEARLPLPVVPKGKRPPNTVYTSKNYDTAQSTTTRSRWVVRNQEEDDDDDEIAVAGDDQCKSPSSTTADDEETKDSQISNENNDEDNNGDETKHLPAGQHLLVDIDGLDGSFLNSEERLAGAMVDLVNDCGLTLLSYHCHGLQPSGVSCVGVLLESHVSLHTWPSEGVITLDLFRCGPKSLIPVVPSVKKMFWVPASPDVKPTMIWAHKLRGFSNIHDGDNGDGATTTNELYAAADMQYFPIGLMMEYKEKIASEKTPFQTIDIYDVIRPSNTPKDTFENSIRADTDSYESRHPELFQPDRIVYLDGSLQSRSRNDAAYHEALVHPGLFAHENPKRVAIIGGGEGATLREVLKHNTVQQVVMVEIDELMVEVSKKYLPQWSDCSNLVGSTDNCFDDPRADVYYEDAIAWFMDRYLKDEDVNENEKFDMIIMDALDPQNDVVFAAALYKNPDFYTSMFNALSDDGVFVSQVGEGSGYLDPSDQNTRNEGVVAMIDSMVNIGFQSVTVYEEGHCGFFDPWDFLVAFKDYNSRSAWYENEALVNLKIQRRAMRVKEGNSRYGMLFTTSPFLYFDGPTMKRYRYPTKANEQVFCRRIPTPEPCQQQHGLNPDYPHYSIDNLEVKPSTLGKDAGRGIFAKVDLPAQSYVGMDRLVHTVYISPATHAVIASWYEHKHWNWDFYGSTIEAYTYGYGHVFSHYGGSHIFVDPSLHTFINHACNAQNNIGYNISITEDADADVIPDAVQPYRTKPYAYNPFAERQMHFYSSGHVRNDIAAGEELFDNYLAMSGTAAGYWKEGVLSLRAQCSGEDIGRVVDYEGIDPEADDGNNDNENE